MNFFKKNNLFKIVFLIILIVIFLVPIIVLGINKDKNITNSKSLSLEEFTNTLNCSNYEKYLINDDLISLSCLENNRYINYMYSANDQTEVSFKDYLKKEEEFFKKIKELIYLKYPAFIADVLTKLDKTNIYLFKEDELIIYFYDYEITPLVNEDLFLKVNYMEIKDYLNIDFNINIDYLNEDGRAIDLNKKLIAFTFDDGPSKYTQDLVDVLNKNKAGATFFMVGKRLEEFAKAVKYVDKYSYEIAYHSWNHQNLTRQSLETIQAELLNSQEILNKLINKDFKLFRPPYGSINNNIKTSLEIPFILWNVDTEDWRNHDSEYLKNYVLDKAKDGDIILFHDMYKETVEAISKVLPELYAKGFQVVSVSDLAKAHEKEILPHKSYRSFPK